MLIRRSQFWPFLAFSDLQVGNHPVFDMQFHLILVHICVHDYTKITRIRYVNITELFRMISPGPILTTFDPISAEPDFSTHKKITKPKETNEEK